MPRNAQKGKKKEGRGRRLASFRCRLCNKRIRVPAGWTVGPAVRRHYWRVHPQDMRPDRGSQ